MSFFAQHAIFDQKKSACGKPPAEGNCVFPYKMYFSQKIKCHFPGLFFHQKFFLKTTKKWRRPRPRPKNIFFGSKKAPVASRQPRKIVLFPENAIFGQKKAPAASRQPEENGFGHFLPKKKSACGKPPVGGKNFR